MKQSPDVYRHTLRDGSVRWEARIYQPAPGRKSPIVSKTFPTLKRAEKWKRDMGGRKDRGERIAGDKRPLAEYLAWWLPMKEAGAVHDKLGRQRAPRTRTLAEYRAIIKRWIEKPPAGLPPLGQVRLDRLGHEVLDAFYAAMQGHTTARVIRGLHGVLRQALAEAVRKGNLPRNPCDLASVPLKDADNKADAEAEPDGRCVAMDEAQAARFLRVARELESESCFSALWHLLLQTGLRPSEALALQWKDLDEATKTVQVRRALVRIAGRKEYTLEVPKTANSIRTVPLPTLTLRELQAWRKRQEAQRRWSKGPWTERGFIFTRRDGTPLDNIRRSFIRVCRAAELGTWGDPPEKTPGKSGPAPGRPFTPAFHPYSLRHTCITLWIRQGVPIHVASKLAGHATAAFTLTVYSHALPAQQLEAAEKMDAMFGVA